VILDIGGLASAADTPYIIRMRLRSWIALSHSAPTAAMETLRSKRLS